MKENVTRTPRPWCSAWQTSAAYIKILWSYLINIRWKWRLPREIKLHHHNYSILRTCQTKTAQLVPAFTARWRSIRKISSAQMTTNPEKLPKHPKYKENSTPPIIKKCRNQKTQSKSPYIRQPELKYPGTQINSQHSQQQIEQHVSEFMSLIITIW